MLLSYGLAFACGENGPRVPLYAELLALVLLLDLWHHIFELRKSNIPRKIAAIVSVLALIVYIPSIYCCACNERLFSFMEKQMRTPGKELIATYNPCPDGAWMKYCYDNYVFPTCYFGFYSIYMGFDSHDSNMRCAATLYDKPFMYFLPEKIIEKANKGELKGSFYLDVADNLYAIEISSDRHVSGVRFILHPEDTSKLYIWQRLLTYHDQSYDLDDFHWKVVNVGSRRILVFTKPLTNVFRRIGKIKLLYN